MKTRDCGRRWLLIQGSGSRHIAGRPAPAAGGSLVSLEAPYVQSLRPKQEQKLKVADAKEVKKLINKSRLQIGLLVMSKEDDACNMIGFL